MPRAIAVPIREQMVQLRQQGKSYAVIGQQLRQSPHSVRQICRRWRTGGAAALTPNYHRCGHPGIKSERLIWRAAVSLKRLHPEWGGGVIRVGLAHRWPGRSIPSERTLQRWFVQAGVATARPPAKGAKRARAHQVHQCWQVDAVSHQTLADGSQASWLSSTDEASGALLESSAFPLWQV